MYVYLHIEKFVGREERDVVADVAACFVNTRNTGNGGLRRRPGTVIAAAIANYRYRANIAINDALADAPANTITRYRG